MKTEEVSKIYKLYNTRAQAAKQQGKRVRQDEVSPEQDLPKRPKYETTGLGVDSDTVPDISADNNHSNIAPGQPVARGTQMQQTTLSRWSFGYINSGSVNSNTRPAATQGSSSTRSTGSRPALSESRDPLDSGLPKPCGQPLVWAEDRQALCESVRYHRAYQQAGYTSGGIAYGFMLDKDCGARAYVDDEIVMTRAGGGCKADDAGVMKQSADQSITASHIASFINSKERMSPVALIAGSGNEACPVALPHRYCVMGYFQLTDYWAEKSNSKVCFKYRFEKIDLKSKSWWAPEGSPLPLLTRTFIVKASILSCAHCHQQYKQVFQQGWICLNENCREFWTLNGKVAPDDLTYSKEFLEERSPWPQNIKPAFDLKPAPLAQDPNHPTLAISLAAWKGIVCPRCGRCISRTIWEEWQCKTENCGFTHRITQPPISASAVRSDHVVEYDGHALPLDRHDNQVLFRQPAFHGHWRVHTYDLLEGNTVTHFHANRALNEMPGGAHDMFLAMQTANLGLQRFPMKASPVQGEMLTSHFATNFGMPYKYIVSVNSKPFEGAPDVIMNGLNRLTWAGKHAVGKDYQGANELLALGYFEKQQIHYHDDGEKDIGPTVATLSLGGEAEMFVRMKEKYFSAKKISADTKNSDMDVLSGCQLYEERMKLKQAYETHDDEQISVALNEFNDKRKTQFRSRLARPCLTMTLRHGDMVVMHGADIQKYFEHEVVPKGKLRFAMTSRYVDTAEVQASDLWKGDFHIDLEDVYTGDVAPVTNPAPAADDSAHLQMEHAEADIAMDDSLAINDDGFIDRHFLDHWEQLDN